MGATVVMTGPTMATAFLAGAQNAQPQPAATQPTARSIAAVAAVNPSARGRKDEAEMRRLESTVEASKSWDRGVQAKDPDGRRRFERELEARIDPDAQREQRRRRGRRAWRRPDGDVA